MRFGNYWKAQILYPVFTYLLYVDIWLLDLLNVLYTTEKIINSNRLLMEILCVVQNTNWLYVSVTTRTIAYIRYSAFIGYIPSSSVFSFGYFTSMTQYFCVRPMSLIFSLTFYGIFSFFISLSFWFFPIIWRTQYLC